MIVTLEGFVLPTRYIIKELTIIHDSDSFQHFHFQGPLDFNPTEKELQTIKYVTKYLNHLHVHDDSVLPYSTLDVILKSITTEKIYIAGNAARAFLTRKLPTSCIVDITSKFGFKYPNELPNAPCFKNHSSRYCSLCKGKFIAEFLKKII